MARSNPKVRNCFEAATRLTDADVKQIEALVAKSDERNTTKAYAGAVASILSDLHKQRTLVARAVEQLTAPKGEVNGSIQGILCRFQRHLRL